MTDREALVLAIAVWMGALTPIEVGWPVVALVAAVGVAAYRVRRPGVVILALALVAAFGAARAPMSPPAEAERTFQGEVVLATDPAFFDRGVRVVITVEGARYEVWAWGSSGGRLRDRLMGERVAIDARLQPLANPTSWQRARRIAGKGTIDNVAGFDVGALHTRVANSWRRTIESGAQSMSFEDRALFAGLVYGDDRRQDPLTADDFDGSGLTHLLAVSGQNVAFVLALVGPVLRRVQYRGRFALVLGVLFLFATVTRFEPSVLRASAMTGIAALGAVMGAEVSSRRILALAVTGLVIVDPLLVHRVAFQLSLAASAGILFWSGRLGRAIPGPRFVIEPLAVTAAAQLAVAPFLVLRFGGVPVASLPANLLAGPAAGPIMMWGLTGGTVAGWLPDWGGALLHVPTRVGLWWLSGVAAVMSQARLGSLGGAHIVLLGIAGWWGLRQIGRGGRVAAAVAVLAVIVSPMVVRPTPRAHQVLTGGSVLWQGDTAAVLEVNPASDPERLLGDLRRASVGRIDVALLQHPGTRARRVVAVVAERYPINEVWAAADVTGGAAGEALDLGNLRLQLIVEANKLTAHVAPP